MGNKIEQKYMHNKSLSGISLHIGCMLECEGLDPDEKVLLVAIKRDVDACHMRIESNKARLSRERRGIIDEESS